MKFDIEMPGTRKLTITAPFTMSAERAVIDQLVKELSTIVSGDMAFGVFSIFGFDDDIEADRTARQLESEDETIKRAEEIKASRDRGEGPEQRRPRWMSP